MSTKQISGHEAVSDYFSSLLFDSNLDVNSDDIDNEFADVELKFAHVKAGYQLLVLWDFPLTRAQALCLDLFLLSSLRVVTGNKLRSVLLNSLQTMKL